MKSKLPIKQTLEYIVQAIKDEEKYGDCFVGNDDNNNEMRKYQE